MPPDISNRAAHDGLLALGGRPSHPYHLSDTIIYEPGAYKDILNFWQDEPWEQHLYERQLEQWMYFQQHKQRNRRTTPAQFKLHLDEMRACLERNAFSYPPWLTSGGPFFFQEQLKLQDVLATWVEYLYWRCGIHETFQRQLDRLRPVYEKAANELLHKLGKNHADLDALELLYGSMSSSSIAEIIGELRRLLDKEGQSKKGKHATEQHNTYWNFVMEFQQQTRSYRERRIRMDRLKVLLDWTREQVHLLIKEKEKEMGLVRPLGPIATMSTGSVKSESTPCLAGRNTEGSDLPQATGSGTSGGCHIMRLSLEVRQLIWEKCIPTGPTAHFFEVLERRRPAHMLHNWSPEFRTCASTAYPSGYIPVYTLLSACRDSRDFVVEHYRRRQQRFYRANGWEWSQHEQSPWQEIFGNTLFESFHWIPGDDLVVLCFPPRQVDRLPAHDAVTFASGPPREVGVLVSEPLYIDSGLATYEGSRWSNDKDRGVLNLIWPKVKESNYLRTTLPKMLDILRKRQPRQSQGNMTKTAVAEPQAVPNGIKKILIFVMGTSIEREGECSHRTRRRDETRYLLGPMWDDPAPEQATWGPRPRHRAAPKPRSYWKVALGLPGRAGGRPGLGKLLDHPRDAREEEEGQRAGDSVALVECRPRDIVERRPFSVISDVAYDISQGCQSLEWPEFQAGAAPRACIVGLSLNFRG